MFSPILSTNFSQFEHLEKFNDSEFKIGDYLMNSLDIF